MMSAPQGVEHIHMFIYGLVYIGGALFSYKVLKTAFSLRKRTGEKGSSRLISLKSRMYPFGSLKTYRRTKTPRARGWTICEMAMDGEDDRNKVFVNINVVLLCCGV